MIGQTSCRNCLPCFIDVPSSGLHRRWFENKDKTNTKRNWQKRDIFIYHVYGGRNLQGRTGKGPKPLGVKSEKGRNLWQPLSVKCYKCLQKQWDDIISNCCALWSLVFLFFLSTKMILLYFLSDIWSGTLTFFVRHSKEMSDCPTGPTNFDRTAIKGPIIVHYLENSMNEIIKVAFKV